MYGGNMFNNTVNLHVLFNRWFIFMLLVIFEINTNVQFALYKCVHVVPSE